MSLSVPFLKSSGDVGSRKVEADRFRRRGSGVILREFVEMAEARMRVGTHSTKTRAEINGTTAKMYRQKGTGHARHGSRKACQLRGGGHSFAKKPRTYGWHMPKKARRAALQAALRAKLEDNEVMVVEAFGISKPRTKDFVEVLARLGVDGTFLVVPSAHDDALWRSCRNVTGSSYRVVTDLNAYEVLRSRHVIMDEAALSALEERFADA